MARFGTRVLPIRGMRYDTEKRQERELGKVLPKMNQDYWMIACKPVGGAGKVADELE